MRPSCLSFGQSVELAIKQCPDVTVDETIARFLNTSACYLKLSAERLAQNKRKNFKLETKEQS